MSGQHGATHSHLLLWSLFWSKTQTDQPAQTTSHVFIQEVNYSETELALAPRTEHGFAKEPSRSPGSRWKVRPWLERHGGKARPPPSTTPVYFSPHLQQGTISAPDQGQLNVKTRHNTDPVEMVSFPFTNTGMGGVKNSPATRPSPRRPRHDVRSFPLLMMIDFYVRTIYNTYRRTKLS